MSEGALVSGTVFFRRLTLFFAATSTIAVAGIALYIYALMRLSEAEWAGFLRIALVGSPVLFAGTTLWNRPLQLPIVRYLDADARGQGTPEGLRAAFRALSELPYRFFLQGLFWWTAAGASVGLLMGWQFETFGPFRVFVFAAAAASGGFVCSVFTYFGLKRLFSEIWTALGRRIADPDERQRLVRPIGVGRKLRWSVTGVTFVTVAFALFLSLVHTSEPLESIAVRLQQSFLVARAEALRDPAAVEGIAEEARELGIASDVFVFDPGSPGASGGRAALLRAELEAISGAVGTSVAFDSPHAFAWRSLGPGGPVAVALQPWEAIAPDASASRLRFGSTLLVSAAIALALAAALAGDIGATTRELGRSAERVASGDLRGGDPFESEDELGELSRAFERMAGALRATVGRVSEAADRVEATAAEAAAVSERVASSGRAQGQGVSETARAMQGVTGQSGDIARSARELNELVEDASSSMMQLGASGEQLAETAGVLFAKVDEVSGSIEAGARSMREVSSNTASLAVAAEDTSSSMGRMASALEQVSRAAADSADRSRRAVETAERGRSTVRQTVESMESIRRATDSAEAVVRGLGTRASEIGSIVDVIGDVADETNLLALNAAIIAAQAGEQGRAFAVVADEIKELAERVLASTKEIGDLIRAVQQESENAVVAIATGTASVAEGVRLSSEADASLEEITQVSRASGDAISEILSAVQGQARASGEVVLLMESVKRGVEAIQRAAREQDRGNEQVVRSSEAMRDVAGQLQQTTGEQARGALRIRETIEGVRGATASITTALGAQSGSCQQVGAFLEELTRKAESNEESAGRMQQVARELLEQANALRGDVERFRV